jgi:hypothetical protein
MTSGLSSGPLTYRAIQIGRAGRVGHRLTGAVCTPRTGLPAAREVARRAIGRLPPVGSDQSTHGAGGEGRAPSRSAS